MYQNKEQSKTVVNSGVSASALIGIALIVLKLVGVINWSWWWVLAPFWMPFGLAIVILIIWLVISIIANGIANGRARK